jgi:hypothetical protein
MAPRPCRGAAMAPRRRVISDALSSGPRCSRDVQRHFAKRLGARGGQEGDKSPGAGARRRFLYHTAPTWRCAPASRRPVSTTVQSTGTSHQNHQVLNRPGPAAATRWPLPSTRHSAHPRTGQDQFLDVAGPAETNSTPSCLALHDLLRVNLVRTGRRSYPARRPRAAWACSHSGRRHRRRTGTREAHSAGGALSLTGSTRGQGRTWGDLRTTDGQQNSRRTKRCGTFGALRRGR